MTAPLAIPVRSTRAAVHEARPVTTGPWPVGWLLGLLATAAVAALILLVAWYAASGEGVLAAQVPWLNAAVGATVLSGLGNCAWLLRGRRSVGELRRSLFVAAPAQTEVANAVVAHVAGAGPTWVRAPGMRRAHRPNCPLVAGKNVVEVDAADAEACGMCQGLAS